MATKRKITSFFPEAKRSCLSRKSEKIISEDNSNHLCTQKYTQSIQPSKMIGTPPKSTNLKSKKSEITPSRLQAAQETVKVWSKNSSPSPYSFSPYQNNTVHENGTSVAGSTTVEVDPFKSVRRKLVLDFPDTKEIRFKSPPLPSKKKQSSRKGGRKARNSTVKDVTATTAITQNSSSSTESSSILKQQSIITAFATKSSPSSVIITDDRKTTNSIASSNSGGDAVIDLNETVPYGITSNSIDVEERSKNLKEHNSKKMAGIEGEEEKDVNTDDKLSSSKMMTHHKQVKTSRPLPNLDALLKETQKLPKLSSDEIKTRLEKCGGIGELRKRLKQVQKVNTAPGKLRVVRKEDLQASPTPSPGKMENDGEAFSTALLDLTPEKLAKPKDVGSDIVVEDISVMSRAYVQYQHLTDKLAAYGTSKEELPLPRKYNLLQNTFESTDQVVSILYNRAETCSFPRVKSGVEQMTRRTFSRDHLGQIITVLPGSYKFSKRRLAGLSNPEGSTKRNSTAIHAAGQYHLILEPSLFAKQSSSEKDDDGRNAARRPVVASPDDNLFDKKSSRGSHARGHYNKSSISNDCVPSSVVSPIKVTHNKNGDRKLISADLIFRKKLFHKNLLAITLKQHQSFIRDLLVAKGRLSEKQTVDEMRKISRRLKRWHPSFQLDDVHDIDIDDGVPDLSNDPGSPTKGRKGPPPNSARALLDHVNEEMKRALVSPSKQDIESKTKNKTALITQIPQIHEALKNVAKHSVRLKLFDDDDNDRKYGIMKAQIIPGSEGNEEKKTSAKRSLQGSNLTSVAGLKGVSSSLIDKIRQREANAFTSRCTQSQDWLIRRDRLCTMIRSLRTLFVTERKPAISITDAITKIQHSATMLTTANIESDIRMLSRCLPNWMALIYIPSAKCDYVKLKEPKKDCKLLIEQIRQMKNEPV